MYQVNRAGDYTVMINNIRESSRKISLPIPLVLFLVVSTSSAYADNYFNPRFLSDDPSSIADLSAFERGLDAPPGTYRVDIYMNQGYMATRDITFSKSDDGRKLEPCLTRSQLSSLGVNTTSLIDIVAASDVACIPFTRLITDASSIFEVGLQRLYLSVPQAFMGSNARGYVAPELWDNGINAGLLNYNYTGSEVRSEHVGSRNYSYLNLQSGINIGAWRLRDSTTWSQSRGAGFSESKWQHANTYVERGISTWLSRLTVGDSYTVGDIFEGINFRGVQVASDDNMLPDSQRGFAPVVRGIARGTAKVSVKQNGYEIYQATVPPGAFTIKDFYATGNSGDLQVSIEEANGSTQTFTVPYASVPMLQREGQLKYALTAGRYRSGNEQQDQPNIFQATALWGMPNDWTVYGGTRLSDNYRSFNMGLGKNLGSLGALSADLTQGFARLPDTTRSQGQSLRFIYSKSLNEWGTNLQLVGYRYSTQGYYSLADTTWNQMIGHTAASENRFAPVTPKFSDFYNLHNSKRGRLQATLTQQVGHTSTMYLTGSRQSYWGTAATDDQIQLGFTSTIKDISWSLNYSLSQSAWAGDKDQLVTVNVNIPFSHWVRSDSRSSLRNVHASYNTSNDLQGRVTSTAGVYGTLLEDGNLGYSVQTGHVSGGNGTAGATKNTALNYRGAYGNADIGYSQSGDYDQLYYGASGGLVAHENGVTFSQPLNETMVLIKAPGANDVSVENQTGVRTDWRGYAVLPFAMDYRENRVSLDANSLASNVELEEPISNVIPTRGAIVRASFKVRIGIKVLMVLSNRGRPVPFGSIATYGENQAESIVAESGQVYLTGLAPSGKIEVKWGSRATERCIAAYSLPANSQSQILSYASAQCL